MTQIDVMLKLEIIVILSEESGTAGVWDPSLRSG
jgi:hypothetical protein